MSTGSKVLITIGAIVVVVGIAVGGWAGGWWLKNASTNKNAQILQNSYGAQTADEQQVQNLITTWDAINAQIADPSTPSGEKSALQAQATSTATQACGLAVHINQPTTDISTWMAINCN